MNVLPLILALVLMLSVLTVEKLEKFKNQTIVQNQYQAFLKMNQGQIFNKREKSLFGISETTLRQLSFRFLIDKKAREEKSKEAQQYRMLILELMKIVYGEAAFFKNLQMNRPGFLEELLTAIEQAAEKVPKKTMRRIQDIARLDLEDPELQEAFYRMLKGSISRDQLENVKDKGARFKEKAYASLFTFIHDGGTGDPPKIVIQRAPREILKAVFASDEIVEAIILRRNELSLNKESGSEAQFKSEFIEKRRPGIEDSLLDFKISVGTKTMYN